MTIANKTLILPLKLLSKMLVKSKRFINMLPKKKKKKEKNNNRKGNKVQEPNTQRKWEPQRYTEPEGHFLKRATFSFGFHVSNDTCQRRKTGGRLYVGNPTDPAHYLLPPAESSDHKGLYPQCKEDLEMAFPPQPKRKQIKMRSQNLERDEGKKSPLRIHKPQADPNVGFQTKFTLSTCPRRISL